MVYASWLLMGLFFAPTDAPPDGVDAKTAARAKAAKKAKKGNAPQATPANLFDRLDRNKDGVLSADEMPKRLENIWQRLDANGDGRIDREEFARARELAGQKPGAGEPNTAPNRQPTRAGQGTPPNLNPQGPNPPADRRLDGLFGRWDKDGNGYLEGNELPARVQENLALIDADGDGRVDRREFAAALAQYRDRMGGSRASQPGVPGRNPAYEAPSMPRDGGLASPEAMERPRKKDQVRQPNARFFPADPEALQMLMDRMDADGDGMISMEEAPPPMKQNFRRLDTNRDGKLSREELLAAAERMKQMEKQFRGGSPREMFYEQDADADGRVTRSEASGRLLQQFDKLDTNSDGKLSLEEVELGLQAD